jgi:hypothetical protein
MKSWKWESGKMSCGATKYMLVVEGHGEVAGVAKHEGLWHSLSFCSILGWSIPCPHKKGLKAAKAHAEMGLFLFGAAA